MKYRGLFITLEGGEGCGKTTHSISLRRYIESKGKKVVLTREPGGTDLGRKIRRTLLSNRTRIEPLAELLLFAADRAEHVSSVVLPALKAGKVVICDRYIDSTTAYQTDGRGLDKDVVRYINSISSMGLRPDLTIVLDIRPALGIERATRKGRDRFEREKLLFHKRVRLGYLNIAKAEPGRVKVVDSEQSLICVGNDLKRIIDRYVS